jgi:flagellar FliL protein
MLALELGMAKKEEKKDEKKPKEPLTPEQAAAAAKKKKIIIAVAAGLVVVAGGAFAAIKMLGKSGKEKSEGHAAEQSEHGDKPAEGETDGSVEGHAEGHAEGKADAKKDEHGKADGHSGEGGDKTAKEGEKKDGEKKDDAHGGKDTEAKKDGADGHGDTKDASDAATPGKSGRYSGIGIMYEMKPFQLNLGNPLENRYVRLEVRLEYPNEEQKSELSARDSQIRDAIVSIVSRKTREHLLSPDGKDQLRLEIKNRVNQYLEKKITNVYITDILIE